MKKKVSIFLSLLALFLLIIFFPSKSVLAAEECKDVVDGNVNFSCYFGSTSTQEVFTILPNSTKPLNWFGDTGSGFLSPFNDNFYSSKVGFYGFRTTLDESAKFRGVYRAEVTYWPGEWTINEVKVYYSWKLTAWEGSGYQRVSLYYDDNWHVIDDRSLPVSGGAWTGSDSRSGSYSIFPENGESWNNVERVKFQTDLEGKTEGKGLETLEVENFLYELEAWGPEPVQRPTVETKDAENIQQTSVTLRGEITNIGGEDAEVDEIGFEWGTISEGPYSNSSTESENRPYGEGDFSKEITGLEPETKYYFRAKAHNQSSIWDWGGSPGWGYGEEKSFTTIPPPSPCRKHNVYGWAWSLNIGWISFSCENNVSLRTGVDYGVDIDRTSIAGEDNIILAEGHYTEERWDVSEDGSRDPTGITTDGNNIWVVHSWRDRVHKYNMDGDYQGFWSLPDDLNDPTGITIDGDSIWVVDNGKNAVFEYGKDNGDYQDKWALHADNSTPSGITTDGNYFWVVDSVDKEVYIYKKSDKSFDGKFFVRGDSLQGITTDGKNIWVVDRWNDQVYKYNMGGIYQDFSWDTAESGSLSPSGITIDDDGNYFWIVDLNEEEVYKYEGPITSFAPVIEFISGSPDPIVKENDITFSVDWHDDDGDGIKMYVCKADDGGASGCGAGGTWCFNDYDLTEHPITCDYATQAGDLGSNDYYIHICDELECSSTTLSSFTVVGEPPLISKFSGGAWSENIGWISFNKDDVDDCPEGSCEAVIDLETGEVSGWARALAPVGDSEAGGWDGWIRLKGTAQDGGAYGVLLDSSNFSLNGYSEFRDWAWGSDVVGWVSFNYKNCDTDNNDFIDVACGGDNATVPNRDYKVMTDLVINLAPSAIDLNVNETTGCSSGDDPRIVLGWTFDDPGDSQSAYRIQIDDDSGFGSPRGCPEPEDTKIINSGGSCIPIGLDFNKSYYWRLRVWDELEKSSVGWIKPGSAFFTTDPRWPRPSFTLDPADPLAEEEIQFDGSVEYCSSCVYSWDFGDGEGASSQDPKHIYDSKDNYTVEFTATSGARSCSASSIISVESALPLPVWQEIPPF